MGGAAVFTGQLLPLLDSRSMFGCIEVTRYNNDSPGRASTWRLSRRDNVRGRVVLVVDDILDEGITLAAIRQRAARDGRARSATRRCSPTRTSASEKPVAADFVGVTVPNRYVFGFGMDAYGLVAQPAGDLRD